MKIAEVAAESGLSIDTIRYYEKAGLCPAIARGSDGRRRFSAENLAWLTLLASLRETGMPTGEMKQFAELYRHGDATVSERKRMLAEHQSRLEEKQAQLDKCKAILAYKLELYDAILGKQS